MAEHGLRGEYRPKHKHIKDEQGPWVRMTWKRDNHTCYVSCDTALGDLEPFYDLTKKELLARLQTGEVLETKYRTFRMDEPIPGLIPTATNSS